MKKMSTFNQIGAGLLVGFGIAFIVGYIVFQAELFRQGAESIGVSYFGFSYFFGGLVVSFILWGLSKGRSSPKYLGFFVIAIIAVGSIGLNNVLAVSSAGDPLDFQRNIAAIAQLVSQILFWGVPPALVTLYGFALKTNSSLRLGDQPKSH
jgi:hypothetical protein